MRATSRPATSYNRSRTGPAPGRSNRRLVSPRTGLGRFERRSPSFRATGSPIPVVVCSAYVTPDALKGLGRGLRLEIVTKPFKASAIVDAAKKMLAT